MAVPSTVTYDGQELAVAEVTTEEQVAGLDVVPPAYVLTYPSGEQRAMHADTFAVVFADQIPADEPPAP